MSASDVGALVTDELRRFVEAVESFCEAVEQVERVPKALFVQRMDELIPLVYHAAYYLPGYPWDDEHDDSEESWRAFNERQEYTDALGESLRKSQRQTRRSVEEALKAILGSLDEYRFVFDALDPTDREAISGSLVHDLASIYWDLKDALELYRTGDELGVREAIWDWSFGRKHHWGCHAIHALPVIHSLIHHHYDEDKRVFDI
jgi:hypothetical protein